MSDCAFIWSADPILLINISIECTRDLIKSGVFCRGGIAYGNIIEPDKVNNRLGKFILGEAATKAVDFERKGKGCRIFSDVELPSRLSQLLGNTYLKVFPFIGNKNPNDCQITDELQWYIFPKGIIHDYAEKTVILALLEIVVMLRHSPMYRWNASNKEGTIQLSSSIETISKATSIFSDKFDRYIFASEYLENSLAEVRNIETKSNIFEL